jgi:hypothetical protein
LDEFGEILSVLLWVRQAPSQRIPGHQTLRGLLAAGFQAQVLRHVNTDATKG